MWQNCSRLSAVQVKIVAVRLGAGEAGGGKLAVSVKSFKRSPTHPSLCTTALLSSSFTVRMFAVIIGEIIIGESSHPRSDLQLRFNRRAAACWQWDLTGAPRAVLTCFPLSLKRRGGNNADLIRSFCGDSELKPRPA